MNPRQFSCEPNSSGSGDICLLTKAATFKYPNQIALLIPEGVESPRDLMMHLHGWRGVCESERLGAAAFAKNYGLLDQMVSGGGSQSVMVVPMSGGRNTAHVNSLAPRFAEFSRWIEGLVEPQSKSWAITGHSGAYRPIGQILGSDPKTVKKIRSVGLIDATYSSSTPGALERAQRVNPRMKVYSTYVARSQTHAVSRWISDSKRIGSKQVKVSRGGGHCSAARRDVADFTRWQNLNQTPIPRREEPMSRIPASVP